MLPRSPLSPAATVGGLLVLIVAAIFFALQGPPAPALVYKDAPQTVIATDPFQVGETYRLGSMSIGSSDGTGMEVQWPITITAVEVLSYANAEIVGSRAFLAGGASTADIVRGWPPNGEAFMDPTTTEEEWSVPVAIVVGVRTTGPKSGIRGVQVKWMDGAGNRGSHTFDTAVLTCAPGACEVDPANAEPMLRELGLQF